MEILKNASELAKEIEKENEENKIKDEAEDKKMFGNKDNKLKTVFKKEAEKREREKRIKEIRTALSDKAEVVVADSEITQQNFNEIFLKGTTTQAAEKVGEILKSTIQTDKIRTE